MVDQTKRDLIATALRDHSGFRRLLSPFHFPADRTWMSILAPSEKLLVNLYETLIYGSDLDQSIRTCVRSGKNAAEVLDHPGVSEYVERIDQAAAAETLALQPPHNNQPPAPPTSLQTPETGGAAGGSTGAPTDSDDDVKTWWRTTTNTKIGETVNFVSDPGRSEAALVGAIETTTLGTSRADGRGNVIIMYDVNLSGESQTAPHVRSAPYRKDHASRFIKAILAARKPADQTTCKLA